MPLYDVLGPNGFRYVTARPSQPFNLIELNRDFIGFDGRCHCGGLIFILKLKTLYWDLVTDEDREHARKRLENGDTPKSVIEENPWIMIGETTVGECEQCGRTHYF